MYIQLREWVLRLRLVGKKRSRHPRCSIWILYGDSRVLWVSFDPQCIPHSTQECLRVERNPAEFSSLIGALQVSKQPLLDRLSMLTRLSTFKGFCNTCIVLGRLVVNIPHLKYGNVKVLLGSLEYVGQKAQCPSCRSISASVTRKAPDTPPSCLLCFHTGRNMWSFQLLTYCDNTFLANEGSKCGKSTAFLPLKPIFPNRKYGRDFATDWINLSLIRSWIQKCSSHSECSRITHDIGLPKPPSVLFIDVNQHCLVSSSVETKYLALSYVWGGIESLKTTTENIDDLRSSGALLKAKTWCTIPQTIKDAIHLTKCLDINYLWVDRLCIVQDDDDSKQSLLQAMPAIYAGAYFTVVAADGDSANHGLRGISCNPRNVSRTYIDLPNATLIEYIHRNADGSESPWAYRGWTFQEALFSRRMLIFNGLITWLCNYTQYYEEIEYPLTWPDYKQSKQLRSLFVQGIPNQKLGGLTWDDTPDLHGWRDLVTSYQRRDLTYDTDVLNAFEGVQTALRPGFPGGFFYGLPEMFFDMALLWQFRQNSFRPTSKKRNERNPFFPSWSWAGWKGELDDLLWEKCFNHVYAPLGKLMSDDYIQIVPLVKWQKRCSTENKFETIANSYHVFQAYNGDSDLALPQGWSFYGEDKSYIWREQRDTGQRFRYPLPIEKQANEASKKRYDPYLHFKTQRAWLRLVPQPDSQVSMRADLEDKSGNWLGTVCLNSEDCFPTADSSQLFHEFIAISLGKAKILTDAEIPGPMLPPASNFRNSFGGRILHEWDNIKRLQATSDTYEFYNVLCLERDGGTYYRMALGRVVKVAWERQDVQEIDVVLG